MNRSMYVRLGPVLLALQVVRDVYLCSSRGNHEIILLNVLSASFNLQQLQKHSLSEKPTRFNSHTYRK